MSIVQYEKNNQTLFKVRVYVRSKDRKNRIQKQRIGITSRPKAAAIEKELLRAATEELLERESHGVLWQELLDAWELHLRRGYNCGRPIQKTTAQDLVAILRSYTKHWGKLPASKVNRSHVRQCLERMDAEGKSLSRKKMFKGAVHSCYEWGIETGKVKGTLQSPAFGIKIAHHRTETKPDILNINEIRKFLQVAQQVEHPWYPIWAFALLTGMRSGEIYALEWSDIDWENDRIIVSKSFNKRLRAIKSTKAGYWREVPVSDELKTLLTAVRNASGSRPNVFHRHREWQSGDQAGVLRRFCEGHGLKSVRFHALRACFATQLIRNAVAPGIVMKICGWKDLKTMARYVRLAGIEVEGATDSLKLLTPRDTMENVVKLFRS